MHQLRFPLSALLWLPAGMAALAALRGPWPAYDPDLLAGLGTLAVAGLPLAFACRALWRMDRRVTSCVAFALLAPATAWMCLIGGLLGPVGVLAYAVAGSLPAWLLWLALRLLRRPRPGPPPGG